MQHKFIRATTSIVLQYTKADDFICTSESRSQVFIQTDAEALLVDEKERTKQSLCQKNVPLQSLFSLLVVTRLSFLLRAMNRVVASV